MAQDPMDVLPGRSELKREKKSKKIGVSFVAFIFLSMFAAIWYNKGVIKD